jgi:hypothetical protein
MNYWEIIADNLSKAGWSWDVCQPWIPRDKQSGVLMRIAVTESVSLPVRMKSGLRFWNWNRRLALAANCLDKPTMIFPDSTKLDVAKRI